MKTARTLITTSLAFMPVLADAAGITNPLDPQYSTLPDFLNRLLDILIMLSIPIVVVAVIYAGFLFVTAGENATKLSNAKKILLWTLIGALIILGAKVIAAVVAGTVGEFTG